MSERYKTDNDGLYFVTFSVVGWIDVFTRRIYQDMLIESLEYCRTKKDMKIFCYCIMPNHIHYITHSVNKQLSSTLRDLKSFTAKQLLKAIEENSKESRKDWMMRQFGFYGRNCPQKQVFQFWNHSNHPFFLYSQKLIQQKVDYIHYNPVKAGFVNEPHEWRMSSANENGPIKLDEWMTLC
jgi:REP element-mobilizing transposase RayT